MEHLQLFNEQLAEEGYRPHIDEDGDIVFRSQGKTYVVSVDPADAQFFRLGAYCLYTLSGEAAANKAHRIGHELAMRFKGTKALIVEDQVVHVVLESVLVEPEHFATVLERLLAIAREAVPWLLAELHRELDVPMAQA